jgi:phospholipase C
VMMENRSFDHVLGYLCLPKFGGRRDIDGLVNTDTDPRFANEYDHQIYRPFEMPDGPLPHDLPHARHEVETQLALSGGTAIMTGFVQAYANSTQSMVDQPPPLGYLTATAVFMSNFLARNYLICDHWFAPLPADTHRNRAMACTGSSLIDDTEARIIPYRNLVLDWLTAHCVRWRVYHSGFSFFSLFGVSEQILGDNFRSVRQLAGDFENDPEDVVPQVIFVEPEYADSPVHFGFIPNDNHPPLPIGPGEHFLGDVYTALANSPR